MQKIKDLIAAARMWVLGVIAGVGLGAVGLLAPQNIPVALWKLALLAVAAVLGYYIDRNLFPYARPHTFIHPQLQTTFGWATLRRAIIVAATMVAFAIAV